jgi:gamma-glutamylcyclotransferase (GGCT)/AIG2-like uncharacterized protein YtfP
MANIASKNRNLETDETFLFVYGTLMRGGKFHAALESSPNVKFVGEARIQAELYRLRGAAFPGAVRTSAPDRFVHGELYSVRDTDRLLERIDEIEGCSVGLFRRDFVEVWLNDEKLQAWTYFYCRSVSSAEPLPHGKFLPADSGIL